MYLKYERQKNFFNIAVNKSIILSLKHWKLRKKKSFNKKKKITLKMK